MAIVTSQPDSVPSGSRAEAAWRRAMRNAIRDGVELCQALQLPRELEAAAARAAKQFSVFAPRGYVAKMRPGDPHDPLLRQVLPLADELEAVTGFTPDPLQETAAEVAPGLLQKYNGRALLITTGVCAVHCRYCFRRHYPYSAGEAPGGPRWGPALAQIAADQSLEEILLSGGDPLTLADAPLAELVEQLQSVRHVRRLRVHTRLPIVIPERVTVPLLDWLGGTRLTPMVVVHANHPAELDAPVAAALERLLSAGIQVLNQAVLLRGVNDNLAALLELSRRLVDLRVQPYYLHQLDRVAGAAHFQVPPAEGLELMQQLRAQLPGYAVPRYVCEVPGQAAKHILA